MAAERLIKTRPELMATLGAALPNGWRAVWDSMGCRFGAVRDDGPGAIAVYDSDPARCAQRAVAVELVLPNLSFPRR